MKTLCKHCLNSCKIFTPNCKKYKTEDMAEIRKDYLKNKDKIAFFDYGIIDRHKKLTKK